MRTAAGCTCPSVGYAIRYLSVLNRNLLGSIRPEHATAGCVGITPRSGRQFSDVYNFLSPRKNGQLVSHIIFSAPIDHLLGKRELVGSSKESLRVRMCSEVVRPMHLLSAALRHLVPVLAFRSGCFSRQQKSFRQYLFSFSCFGGSETKGTSAEVPTVNSSPLTAPKSRAAVDKNVDKNSNEESEHRFATSKARQNKVLQHTIFSQFFA